MNFLFLKIGCSHRIEQNFFYENKDNLKEMYFKYIFSVALTKTFKRLILFCFLKEYWPNY